MKPRRTVLSLITATILLMLYNIRQVQSIRCFICEFNMNYCKDPPNCYNNPDICSPNQFSSILAPLQECPRNCMLKAVTNPAGVILKWKRLCAPASDLTHGFQCRIDYIFGARIEQCTCDKDYCNGANTRMSASVTFATIATLCLAFSIGVRYLIMW